MRYSRRASNVVAKSTVYSAVSFFIPSHTRQGCPGSFAFTRARYLCHTDIFATRDMYAGRDRFGLNCAINMNLVFTLFLRSADTLLLMVYLFCESLIIYRLGPFLPFGFFSLTFAEKNSKRAGHFHIRCMQHSRCVSTRGGSVCNPSVSQPQRSTEKRTHVMVPVDLARAMRRFVLRVCTCTAVE